jgi:hypothetical protein
VFNAKKEIKEADENWINRRIKIIY